MCIRDRYRDWYPVIKSRVKSKWNEEWSNIRHNKLRTIKEFAGPWPSSNSEKRKESIILTRLRIGHTKVTHQYLMERGLQPYCLDCIVPLTVMHFIAECPSHTNARNQTFQLTSNMNHKETLKHILADDSNTEFHMEKLISYLREIDMINKII